MLLVENETASRNVTGTTLECPAVGLGGWNVGQSVKPSVCRQEHFWKQGATRLLCIGQENSQFIFFQVIVVFHAHSVGQIDSRE